MSDKDAQICADHPAGAATDRMIVLMTPLVLAMTNLTLLLGP